MTIDEIKAESREREYKLLMQIVNILRCGESSGYTTFDQLKDFAEKELKKIQKWVDSKLPLEDE